MKRTEIRGLCLGGFTMLMTAAVLCWPSAQVWATDATLGATLSGSIGTLFTLTRVAGCPGGNCELGAISANTTLAEDTDFTGANSALKPADQLVVNNNTLVPWGLKISATQITDLTLLVECLAPGSSPAPVGACVTGYYNTYLKVTASPTFFYSAIGSVPATNGTGEVVNLQYTAFQNYGTTVIASRPQWTVTYTLTTTF